MELRKYADDCAKQFSLMDFGLLKLCVGSAGVIAGLLVPKKKKKKAIAGASAIFGITLIPLLLKFIRVIIKNDEEA